jgi:hypothetical protein
VQKRTTSRVMVASRPKVSLWPEGSTSPGNYGWLFVFPLSLLCIEQSFGEPAASFFTFHSVRRRHGKK